MVDTVYRTNTFPLIHAGFFHTFFNLLALTPLLERFEAEHGTITTLALFMGRTYSSIEMVALWDVNRWQHCRRFRRYYTHSLREGSCGWILQCLDQGRNTCKRIQKLCANLRVAYGSSHCLQSKLWRQIKRVLHSQLEQPRFPHGRRHWSWSYLSHSLFRTQVYWDIFAASRSDMVVCEAFTMSIMKQS